MDRQALQERYGIIGESDAIKQVIDKIMQVSGTDITVLLQGESGVGKDVTARAIHSLSKRDRKDIVIVNCGAIPEGIIESELLATKKDHLPVPMKLERDILRKPTAEPFFLMKLATPRRTFR